MKKQQPKPKPKLNLSPEALLLMQPPTKQPDRSVARTVGIALLLILVICAGLFAFHSGQQTSTRSTGTGKATVPKVVTTTFSAAPADLRAAVKAHAKTSGCPNSSGQFLSANGTAYDPVTYYIAGVAAKVNACSARQLYTFAQGQWNYDMSGEDDIACTKLNQYHFPAALIIAGTNSAVAGCLDANGKLLNYGN